MQKKDAKSQREKFKLIIILKIVEIRSHLRKDIIFR